MESFHLSKEITSQQATSVIRDTVSALKNLYPEATSLHVKFTGVMDRTLAGGVMIKTKEKFAKKRWLESKIGIFVKNQDMINVDLLKDFKDSLN